MRPVRSSILVAVAVAVGATGAWLRLDAGGADAQGSRFVIPQLRPTGLLGVGFLDNGCTASLIDANHIVAAAHCFTYDDRGVWQGPLRFYPNFHPQNTSHPFSTVQRAVVGTRVQTGSEFVRSDWGIAAIDPPIAGVLPLVFDVPGPVPATVHHLGYARDTAFFGPGPKPPGLPTPADFLGNVWWQPAIMETDCTLLNVDNDYLSVTCKILGGDSGSPILDAATGPHVYRVLGVVHGGSGGPSAARFIGAPRQAGPVAVSSVGTGRTALWALDVDAEHLTGRVRASPSTTARFAPFRRIGYLKAPRDVAAASTGTGSSRVFVVSNGGALRRIDVAPNLGSQWATHPGPPGSASVDAVDAAEGLGSSTLYASTTDGALFRQVIGQSMWTPITSKPNLSALATERLATGADLIVVAASSGVWISRVSAAGKQGGLAPVTLPEGSSAQALDVKRLQSGAVLLVMLDSQQRLWTRLSAGADPTNGGWSDWRRADIPLWAPQLAAKASPLEALGAYFFGYFDEVVGGQVGDLAYITVDQWREPNAAQRPILFATDLQGNIYVSEQQERTWGCTSFFSSTFCLHRSTVWTAWRSFYD
ncbi:MAG: hypothetical protein R3E10_15660 [Gemmatimonadota bacterium]